MTPKDRFLQALRREAVDRPPVWLMRQAGRYLPEYQELRRRYDFLELCLTPEAACEATLQPVKRFGVDAAIIFSDILLPCRPMGVSVTYEDGVGPRLEPAIHTEADVERLRSFDPERELAPVLKALQLTKTRLQGEALIGFIGSPWTVAAYLVEGQGKTERKTIVKLLHESPRPLAALLEKVTDALIPFAQAQVAAGADVIQIFDSWGGWLSPAEYHTWSLPSLQRITLALRERVPTIVFVRGTRPLLQVLRDVGSQAVSIDHETPMAEAIEVLGTRYALQGNLDPATLLQSDPVVQEATRRLLAEINGRASHLINLGHGVLPTTPPPSVAALVETVKSWRSRK